MSTKCFLGVGSNLGERLENLEKAAQALRGTTEVRYLRVSPIVENPALVPEGASEEWRKPFLNAAIEIEWLGNARELLMLLKKTEQELGRVQSSRWAPRVIDLDLLLFGEQQVKEHDFVVPHAGLWDRSFVLSPLKHLAPSLIAPLQNQSILAKSRKLSDQLPLWMGILNLTPDSFSDGSTLASSADLEKRLEIFDQENVQILDLGAESTRPGAHVLSPEEEWCRLKPALELVRERYRDKLFKPFLSVDTYHAEVAIQAYEMGADIINDVSGCQEPEMLSFLSRSSCQYVLMHSLSVPANPKITLDSLNPVEEIYRWAERKLEVFNKANIHLDRIYFDPGIGFAKTASQSQTLVREIETFLKLPVRLLVGHSRKSFLGRWGEKQASNRDAETLGTSLKLAQKGVDVLRVHVADLHQKAFRAFQEA